jgi:hypothetical protein
MLTLLARTHAITSSRLDKQYRLEKILLKIQDLQRYAANIADGKITMSEMLDTPCSMFGRQMMFMQWSHNTSLMGTQQQMTAMAPMINMQMSQMQPQMQAWYQQNIFQQMYQQQREQRAKEETRMLNEQEKELQAEKLKLETEIKMLDQEYESSKQAVSKDIETFWKPNYTG